MHMKKIILLGLVVLFAGVGCHPKKSLPTPETKSGEETTASQRQTEILKQNAPTNSQEKTQLTEAYDTLDAELRKLEFRIAETKGEKRIKAETDLDELKKRRSELQIQFDESKYQTLLRDIQAAVPASLPEPAI